MKAGAGVTAELFALACVFAFSPLVPRGTPFGLYVVAAELLATYLIHCPAHYMVGGVFGVRFASIRRGRSTLAKALPAGLADLARPIPIITLKVSKTSLSEVPRRGLASMYAAGTIASVASAFVVALFATPVDPPAFAALAWAMAAGYLLFDLVFSPKSGDLARARRALLS